MCHVLCCCLSVCLCVTVSVCLYVCLCVSCATCCVAVCLCVCMSVCLSVDTRKALCYTNIRDGRCLNPSTIPVTRSTCCCMVDNVEPVLIGWGQPCTVCPPVDLEEYQLLCPYGPGLTNTGAGLYTMATLESCYSSSSCIQWLS